MTNMPPTVFLPNQVEHEMPIPLDNGELARAMTRSATPDNEDFLLRIAQHGAAQHVENLVG